MKKNLSGHTEWYVRYAWQFIELNPANTHVIALNTPSPSCMCGGLYGECV